MFGRPFKLDLHTVVGTTLALEEWLELDHGARWSSYAELVGELAEAVAGLPGGLGGAALLHDGGDARGRARQLPGRPRGSRGGQNPAADVERALDDGNLRIAVHRWDDTLIVAVDTMLPEQCAYVCERLRAALT